MTIRRECITGKQILSTRRIAIIGGTGFGEALFSGRAETCQTEYGPAQITRSAFEEGVELIFLARHGPGHRLPPHLINHRANIAALRDLEAEAVIATAAVGSLRRETAPGDFVMLDDFLDFSKGPPTTFFDSPGNVCHTDFVQPYTEALRQVLIQEAGDTIRPRLHLSGSYLCVSGPRYETPAEIRYFAALGADVIGMTGAPEAILCREAGLPYSAIALVTNYGSGLLDATPLSHIEVEQRMAASRTVLADWLLRAVSAISRSSLIKGEF